ncbi:MAG TPA: hypothetical protein PLT32_03495 [bacterium]|nr:hypothetical protein [bacterium]
MPYEPNEKKCKCGRILINKNGQMVADKIQSGDHNGVIACPECQRRFLICYETNNITLMVPESH